MEERICTVDWNKRDVLIGLVTDSDHLQLFLKSKLYWTRRFDKVNLPIRYVALYEKGSGIRYYGELISYSQRKRSQLPGASKHSSKDYHVFEVLQWHELPEIITMEESGPNPVAYTNYFLLSIAKTYSELRLRNEADYRFFIELKRRTDPRILDEEGSTAFEFGETKVLIESDMIHIIRDGSIVKSENVVEFNKHPNATFRMLQSCMSKLS